MRKHLAYLPAFVAPLLLVAAAACTGDDPAACNDCGADAAVAQGFEVAAPADVTVLSGTVVEIDITITRAGYGGAINVAVQDLPANVSAGGLTIAAGAATGKVVLTALPAAAHGKKAIKIVASGVDGKLTRDRASSLLVRGASGALDNSFGELGRAAIVGGAGGFALTALVVQADGKILASGMSEKNIVVARLDADGKVDATFGTAGKAVANIRTQDPGEDHARALAVGPGGKVIVAGNATLPNEYAVARFDGAGRPDNAFDVDGVWSKPHKEMDWNGEVRASGVAVLPDGKVVFGGLATEYRGGVPVTRAVIARLTDNGALDATFGGGAADGWIHKQAQPPISAGDPADSSDDACESIALAPGGRILCAGWTESKGATPVKSFFVYRVNADGTDDTSFGLGSVASLAYAPASLPGSARTVHALADGRVVLSGESNGKAVVVRLDAQGRTDASFNTSGILTVDTLGTLSGEAHSVIDRDGRVLVVTSTGTENDIAVARVTDKGVVDATFGAGGRAITKVSAKAGEKGGLYNARAGVQADGRIIVATTIDGQGVVVFRLWP